MPKLAPAVRVTRRLATLAALLLAACSDMATAPVAGPAAQGVTVVISPRSVPLTTNAQRQFLVTVTGTPDTAVTWSVSPPGCGSVTAAGLYTAPAADATCQVVVTLDADDTKHDAATVTVTRPNVTIVIAPKAVPLATNAQRQFQVTVTGTTDTAVTWSVAPPGCGSVTPTGLYTAPAADATCQVVVTSHANDTRSDTATVTVTAPPPPPPITDTVWEPLKVGAGGFVTGIDMDPTGTTYVVRTDTYGAYVGDGAGAWRQVVSAASMPASYVAGFTSGTDQLLGEGVYEIRVAPSDPDRLYMIFRSQVWRSDDRGTTWHLASTGFVGGGLNPNDGTRTSGEKMAVDPANADVVYAGAAGGVYRTGDGGASWSLVAGVPAPTAAGRVTGIAVDPSGGATAGQTNVVFAVSNGNGVYRSTNAGASWALLAGGPTTANHGVLATDGAYYVVNGTANVYRWSTGAWATLTGAGVNSYAVATDPFDPARVIVGRDSGNLSVSTDRGATWSGWIWTMTRQSPEIPWMAMANESYMSTAAQRFDPVVRDKLWFAEGIGVWYTANPANRAGTTWMSHSVGIEQLVAIDVVAPPGSPNVLLAGSDRSVWVVSRANTAYATRYETMGSSAGLIAGHAVNYSVANPTHLVAIVNRGLAGEPEVSGYSLDAGATWTRFPVQPGSGGQCGDIVAPSIDNIITVIGRIYAFRSTDRGATWTRLTFPGDGGGNSANLHQGYNTCQKHVLAVDGADPGTVYLYFYGHGVYRSTDGGATWTLVNTGTFDGSNMYWQVHLRAVPGRAGHLFMTAGQAGGNGNANPHATSLWRSTDGGVTWARFQQGQIAEPYDIAFGAAAPGHSYPAAYFAGWQRSSTSLPWTWGIWRSIDLDTNPTNPTWTQIGPFPYGSFDQINNMAASQDAFGELYIAYNGSGWITGRLK